MRRFKPLRVYKQFRVTFVEQWGFADDEGEYYEEALGGTLLEDDDDFVLAELLAHSWAAGLAHHRYGPGQIVVLDATGELVLGPLEALPLLPEREEATR